MPVTTPKAGDYTGREASRLRKQAAKELSERQDELALASRLEQDAIENDVLDYTEHNAAVPVLVDEVVVLTDDEADTDENLYRVVRVAEDVEQATIASHEGIKTYDFKAGRRVRVPKNVADVLKERGLLYDRL